MFAFVLRNEMLKKQNPYQIHHTHIIAFTMKHILCFAVCNPMLITLQRSDDPGAAGGGSRRKEGAIREISKSQHAPAGGTRDYK